MNPWLHVELCKVLVLQYFKPDKNPWFNIEAEEHNKCAIGPVGGDWNEGCSLYRRQTQIFIVSKYTKTHVCFSVQLGHWPLWPILQFYMNMHIPPKKRKSSQGDSTTVLQGKNSSCPNFQILAGWPLWPKCPILQFYKNMHIPPSKTKSGQAGSTTVLQCKRQVLTKK